MSITILSVLVGCSEKRSTEIERIAIRRSVESLLKIPDPITMAPGNPEIERALDTALKASRQPRRTTPLGGDDQSDLEAWNRLAHLAAIRKRELLSLRRSIENDWSVVVSRAEAKLEEASVYEFARTRTVAKQLQTAQSQLTLSYTFASKDRLPDAIEAASRSIEASELAIRENRGRLARFDDPASLDQWSDWVESTIRQSAQQRSVAIVIDKRSRKLFFYSSGQLQLSFDIELGFGAPKAKQRKGDGGTPEGQYLVREVRTPATTRYHRAFLLDYPNQSDQIRFRDAKRRHLIPADARIGGDIEIHGEGGQGRDWTEGCVALTNDQIDHIASRVKVGTPVTIVGRAR